MARAGANASCPFIVSQPRGSVQGHAPCRFVVVYNETRCLTRASRSDRSGCRHQARARALSGWRAGDQRPGGRPREDRLARLLAADPALQGRHPVAAGTNDCRALAEPARCPDLSGGGDRPRHGPVARCVRAETARPRRSWSGSMRRSTRRSRTRHSRELFAGRAGAGRRIGRAIWPVVSRGWLVKDSKYETQLVAAGPSRRTTYWPPVPSPSHQHDDCTILPHCPVHVRARGGGQHGAS